MSNVQWPLCLWKFLLCSSKVVLWSLNFPWMSYQWTIHHLLLKKIKHQLQLSQSHLKLHWAAVLSNNSPWSLTRQLRASNSTWKMAKNWKLLKKVKIFRYLLAILRANSKGKWTVLRIWTVFLVWLSARSRINADVMPSLNSRRLQSWLNSYYLHSDKLRQHLKVELTTISLTRSSRLVIIKRKRIKSISRQEWAMGAQVAGELVEVQTWCQKGQRQAAWVIITGYNKSNNSRSKWGMKIKLKA